MPEVGPTRNWTLHSSKDPKAKQRPIVFFVHHFQGNEKNLKKHVELVNNLGFDASTFQLSWHAPQWILTPERTLHRAWEKDILFIFEKIKRPFVLFSFSGPGAAAIQALSKHTNLMRGMIFDSGPFWDLKLCYDNLLNEYYGVHNFLLRQLMVFPMAFLLARSHQRDLSAGLKVIQEAHPDLPILSIQGQKDSLVPAHQIDLVFQNRGFNSLNILNLPCGHLTGLKECPEAYKFSINGYLSRFLE